MNSPALPREHAGVRWFFASLNLTWAVTWLLFLLERMRSGKSGPPWPFGRIGEDDAGWIALLFTGLAFVNGWLLDGLLELRTLQEGRTRPGIRIVRFLALGVPLIGIYAMPIWLSLLDRKPEWAIAPLSTADSPPRRLLLFFSSRTQWLRLSVPFFTTLTIGNLFFFGAGVAWLGATQATLFDVRLIDHAAWMLRVLGISAGLIFLAAQRSASVPLRVPRPIPLLLLPSWMAPWPWCMAGAVVLLVFDPQKRPGTLVQGTFGGRQSAKSVLMHLGRFDWWKLSLLQRFRWLSGRSPAQPAEAERRLAGLYRLKTFLLFPEVALLTAVLAALPWPAPLAQIVNLLVVAVFYGALAFALAGALLVVLGAFRRPGFTAVESGSPPDRTSWSLVLTALATAAGACVGSALGRGDVAGAAGALGNIGLAGMVGAAILAQPFRFGRSRLPHHPLSLIGWLLVFAGLGHAGFWAHTFGASASWAPRLMIAVLWLTPMASALVGAVNLRWLLHPYTLRHLDDGHLPLHLRLSLLFLTVTAWAPGGGLAAPLWTAARRRLLPGAVQPQPPGATEAAPPSANGGSRLADLSAEQRNYLLRHAISHQVANGTAEVLFRRIEKHPFFADQANGSGGFRLGSEDLEKHILPLALQNGDWERFLRYSSLAINLRRIADDLAEPDLLPALARNGHRQLAFDAAARVADPVRRALGWASLAASLDPDDADRKDLLDLVRNDLALLAPIDDPEEAQTRAMTLLQIGLSLGPEILPALERIPPPRAGQEPRSGLLAMSAAAGALQRNGGLDAEAWRILRNLQEEEILAEFLPDQLGNAAATAEPARLLENLSTLSLRPETLWACRLSILARQAQTSPQEAVVSWKSLPIVPPLPWSATLIERGAPLFAALSDPELDTRMLTIEDPVARAALRVIILEHRSDGAPDAAAREAIEQLPPGPERLHWTLRRTTSSPMPAEIRRAEILASGRWLFEHQYRAPFADLRRYLELVARVLPDEMQRRTEDVLLSPGGGAPLLFHLAETCASRAILENLFEQAESYLSSLVGLPQLEGLRLWRELMIQLTGRLCLLRGDLTALDQASTKLREMDPVVARATEFLASAGFRELAAEASARIQSGRLRLATRLRWLPKTVTSSRDLEPEPLYRALASVGTLEDEWLGLAALHDPDPPEILFQRYLDRMGDRDTQAIALFRLTRQVLDNSETTREKRQLVLQMLGQALGAMQSDARLAALTPWLPELVARFDPIRAIEEYREAFARLLGLHTVPWTVRRDALETLLVRLTSTLREAKASSWTRTAPALFAGFEEHLADGIPGQEESATVDFLPVLTAALERLPAEVTASLESPIGSRLDISDAESEPIRALCQASVAERVRSLETWRTTEPPFRLTQALAYLLIGSDQALAIIDRFPAGSERDDLCRRLVAHGWVVGPGADELIRRIGDSGTSLETRLLMPGTTASEKDPMRWMELLASRIVDVGANPSEPTWGPVLEEIWSCDPRQSRPTLAEAVLAALGREAPQTAENALRLWLHAHLSPRDGHAHSGVCKNALEAILASLALSPAPGAA